MASEVETRKSIIKIFQEHLEWSFIKIAREAGVYRKTVSIVIRRFKKDLTIRKEESEEGKRIFRIQKQQRKRASEEMTETTIKSMMEGIPEKIKNFCQK